ncbi:MAG: zinc-ribbon and DUF3426 domain-containing protein [Cytophagales bacterium]|nr:zinc-ribbon and DUF3426 domain-containing protein [Cytophagales bacterium]
MSLVTTCPNCGTVFRLLPEQLTASDGQVRCGHCMVVFDANQHTSTPPPVSVMPSEPPQAELSFIQQAQKNAFWSRTSVRFMLVLVSFLLLLLLALQIIRTERERIKPLAPQLHTMIEATCHIWSCPTLTHMGIEGWRIENSSFQKEGASSFRLIVQIKNIAATSLLVPQLELSLLDAHDALLIRRVIPLSAEQHLPSGQEQAFHFLIRPEPELQTIVGYRLVLFYP